MAFAIPARLSLSSTGFLVSRMIGQSPIWPSRWAQADAPRTWHSLLPSVGLALPAFNLNMPAILHDIWTGILLHAVPKKKPSYSKSRMRQLAGKALKDVTSICRCPGCGQTKRSHRVCEACLDEINKVWDQKETGLTVDRC